MRSHAALTTRKRRCIAARETMSGLSGGWQTVLPTATTGHANDTELDSPKSASNEIEQRVYALAEYMTGIRAERMRQNPNMVLNTTIDGDDARDLIQKFAQEFRVDMSGYALEKYFGSEGIRDPISVIVGWIVNRKKFEPLTAQHLIEVARRGSWLMR